MNSRKAARAVPQTINRLLKSAAMLKTPPPAFYPLLAHPPPPSLVRFLPPRPDADLPPSMLAARSPYQQAKAKLDAGLRLADEEKAVLKASPGTTRTTRRRPPRSANSRKNSPLPIVFPEDQLRKQFFRDHPFEAYRPVFLTESETLREETGPNGESWTQLSQRSSIPTAEDAIAFTLNLVDSHDIPLATAYSVSLAQFRTLRSEHENATRAATLQAEAHGAVFFGEIQRGVQVEERVLDGWSRAREIQEQIAASRGSGQVAPGADVGMWARTEGVEEQAVAPELGEVEFTGGVSYVDRFTNRGVEELEEEELEAR